MKEKKRKRRRKERRKVGKENEFSRFFNGAFLSFLERAFKCNLTVLRKMGLVTWLSGKKHLSVLGKTRVWFPTPTRWLTTICNSTSRGSDTVFWPSWASGMHGVHTHACTQAKHSYWLNKINMSLKGEVRRRLSG